MSVLFLGTSSGAGKTTVAAMYCRHLFKKGVDAVPFKASNLSLNSFVTADGKEIGMGQAFQAWAAGAEPNGHMNPVLLKPCGSGKIELVLRGMPFAKISSENPMDVKSVMEKVCESYDILKAKHGTVVCEGSGSPAELNLRDRDLANIGMMRARKIPAVLVGDIERGGVFAALYGTWRLMPEEERPLLKGFIINRFRGDASILKSGTDRIEELTGMKCLGVIPRMDLKFPEEDSLSEKAGGFKGAESKKAFLDNLDALLEEAVAGSLDFKFLDDLSSA